MITAAALAAAVTVTAATPSGVAAKSPKPLTVGVFDNYFAPIPKKAIKKGTTVRWKWDANALDVHDVKLDKGPKGAKKFQSDPLAAGLTFSKKLTVPGKYTFICTFHTEMTMKLTVAKS
ncbi:MAG: plastocyanin/azurin family copper-binding protein [Baekduia sp.]